MDEFKIYKIWYDDWIVYVGRTKQNINSRLRGHFFGLPMHRKIDIHNVSKIECTFVASQADMYLYEIYYINKYKPLLNCDDKARDDLTVELPELEFTEIIPKKFNEWRERLE